MAKYFYDDGVGGDAGGGWRDDSDIANPKGYNIFNNQDQIWQPDYKNFLKPDGKFDLTGALADPGVQSWGLNDINDPRLGINLGMRNSNPTEMAGMFDDPTFGGQLTNRMNQFNDQYQTDRSPGGLKGILSSPQFQAFAGITGGLSAFGAGGAGAGADAFGFGSAAGGEFGGLGALGEGYLGATGAAATAGAPAASQFNLFDPATWSNPFSSGPSELGGPVLNAADLAELNAASGAWSAKGLAGAGELGGDLASKVGSLLKAGSTASSIAGMLGISEGAVGTIGKLLATGLGMYGSNQQAKSLQELAGKYQEYGAPSRGRYEQAMTPGFDPTSIPGYAGALDSTSKSLLARLSASGGNPYGNPGGLIDANKQIVSGTALPAINEYTRQNANVGFGNSMNSAMGLQTGAINADRGITTALSSGLGDLTAPDNSLAALLKQMQGFNWNQGMGL